MQDQNISGQDVITQIPDQSTPATPPPTNGGSSVSTTPELTSVGGGQELRYTYVLKGPDGKMIPLPKGATLKVTPSDPAAITAAPDATPVLDNGMKDSQSSATGHLKGQGKVEKGVTITFSLVDAAGNQIVPDVVKTLDSLAQGPSSASVTLTPEAPPATPPATTTPTVVAQPATGGATTQMSPQ